MPNLNHTARIIELLRENEGRSRHLQRSRSDIAAIVGCSVGRVGEVVRAGGVHYDPQVADSRRGNRAARRSQGCTGRKFGVELEFIGSMSAVASALRSAGLDCNVENYNHRTRTAWKVVPDGSVFGGGELVSPILRGEDGREQVRKACAALQAAGATVNRTTGLHVHHDAKGMSLQSFQRLARLWYEAQPATDWFVAPSRRSTGPAGYCRPLTEMDVANVERMASLERRCHVPVDRMKSLNLTAFNRHGTVEVRQHQGTTDAKKVIAWIDFGQAMVAYAEDTQAMIIGMRTVEGLLAALTTLSTESAAFLAARAASFQTLATRRAVAA